MAARAALKRKPKAGGSVFDLYRLEKEHAVAELRACRPTVFIVDADEEMLESSARAIAALLGDDLDGCD